MALQNFKTFVPIADNAHPLLLWIDCVESFKMKVNLLITPYSGGEIIGVAATLFPVDGVKFGDGVAVAMNRNGDGTWSGRAELADAERLRLLVSGEASAERTDVSVEATQTKDNEDCSPFIKLKGASGGDTRAFEFKKTAEVKCS